MSTRRRRPWQQRADDHPPGRQTPTGHKLISTDANEQNVLMDRRHTRTGSGTKREAGGGSTRGERTGGRIQGP